MVALGHFRDPGSSKALEAGLMTLHSKPMLQTPLLAFEYLQPLDLD